MLCQSLRKENQESLIGGYGIRNGSPDSFHDRNNISSVGEVGDPQKPFQLLKPNNNGSPRHETNHGRV